MPSAATAEKVAPAPLPVLEGRLVDDKTGEPIPFVEIGIKQFPVRRFTFTDENGHFSFTYPPDAAYGLESGPEYWVINEGARASTRPEPPSDSFEFLGPSNVSIKDKTGKPSEGKLEEFHGLVFKGKHYPPPGKEIRRFRYDSSVIELRTDKLSPGKLASR
jgi:hypothetical protein